MQPRKLKRARIVWTVAQEKQLRWSRWVDPLTALDPRVPVG
jgi:hypothetical protein